MQHKLAKKYYDQKKDDPEYIQKKRESAKRYYLKRKELIKKANFTENSHLKPIYFEF